MSRIAPFILLVWITRIVFGQPAQDIRSTVAEEVRTGSPLLAGFYSARDYRPAWFEDSGDPRPDLENLIRILQSADTDGLKPDRYAVPAFATAQALERRSELRDLAADDVALTRTLLQYLTDLYFGRVPADRVHPGWAPVVDRSLFEQLLVVGWPEGDLESFVDRFAPPYPEYARLRRALKTYRRIQANGGWPRVTGVGKLENGDSSPTVLRLRARLAAEPGAPTQADDIEMFDDELRGAVTAFQRRHGLKPDGVVGPATLAALNVPVEHRMRQIEFSMERWRWMPKQPAPRYIVVNVGGGRLSAVGGTVAPLQMKVIVGKKHTPTPIFRSEVTGVVLAPYWNVPRSIATGEILPRLRRNSGYLSANHMRLFLNGREMSAAAVNWSGISARGFPYQIRQDPGPGNPLGRIKFVFPNAYSVGLHDTSEPTLFDSPSCNFSHGCIRLEKPMDLALFSLQGTDGWTAERLDSIIDRWKETVIDLPAPIPVYVLYWTVWADGQGAVHFRDDVYGHDARLARLIGP